MSQTRQSSLAAVGTRDRRSLVEIARTALEASIHSGEHRAGTRLPSEEELAVALSVSRPTVREALREMERAGLVQRRRGVGTFVLRGALVDNPLEVNSGVNALITHAGMEPGCADVSIEVVAVPDDVAAELGAHASSPHWRVHRVRTADGIPIAATLDYVDAAITLDRDGLAEGRSIHESLESAGVLIHHGIAEVLADSADAKLARMLSIKQGAPLLTIKQVDYDVIDRPVLYSIESHVNHGIRMMVHRRGPQA